MLTLRDGGERGGELLRTRVIKCFFIKLLRMPTHPICRATHRRFSDLSDLPHPQVGELAVRVEGATPF